MVLFGLGNKARFVTFHTTRLVNQIGIPRFAHAGGWGNCVVVIAERLNRPCEPR